MHVQTLRKTACCHCPDPTHSGPGQGRKRSQNVENQKVRWGAAVGGRDHMLSVTTSQALCPVLSIPRVPWGQVLRSLPALPPPVLPQTRTQRCREMRLCALLSGTLWADLIVGKSPLGVSSTNLAVRTGLGVVDRVTPPPTPVPSHRQGRCSATCTVRVGCSLAPP